MFASVQEIQAAATGVLKLAAEKGYEVMELDNRLSKLTQDVVFKIKVKNVVSELQLALEFDTTSFEFGHSFYEIQRCPLGSLFGCSLFLAKEVDESFLQQLTRASKAINRQSSDPAELQSLQFVLAAFQKSTNSN